MTSAKTQQLNSRTQKIMNFCNMLNNSTTSAVEYFKRAKKQTKRTVKPVIKKRIFERHYIKDTVYINPNIQAMMDRVNQNNKNSAVKFRNFIDYLTM